LGVTRVKSKITLSEETFSFVILYLGQHHVVGHTFHQLAEEQFRSLGGQFKRAFEQSNLSAVIELLHTIPSQKAFSYFDLFKDEQIHLLQGILQEELAQATNSYQKINNRNYNLMNVMRAAGLEVPELLRKNLEQVMISDLEQLFEDSDRRISVRKLRNRVSELGKWGIQLDEAKFRYKIGHRLRRLAESVQARSNREEALINIRQVLEIIRPLGIEPDLVKLQEIVFRRLKQVDAKDKAYFEALKGLGASIGLEVGIAEQVLA
jgi:tetratricopeptide (TPR) repeat protein